MVLRRLVLSALLVALLAHRAASAGAQPGTKGRIAGDGADAKYWLAKDVEAAIVINQIHTLEFYKTQGEPGMDLGYHLKDIDDALAKLQATALTLEKKGRLVRTRYNQPVTAVENEQDVKYPMFPDKNIAFGRDYVGKLTKITVDDGALKGREYYARRLVDRNHVVATDRAWLKVPGMKAVPVSEDQKATGQYWTAMAKSDSTASAQAYIDGNFTQVAQNTQCTVLTLSSDHNFALVRVKKDGLDHDYWVLAAAASLDAPI